MLCIPFGFITQVIVNFDVTTFQANIFAIFIIYLRFSGK